MHAKRAILALFWFLLGACRYTELDEVARKEAVVQTRTVIEATNLVRPALDFIGLLPIYDCKEAGDGYMARIVEAIQGGVPASCVTVTQEYADGQGRVRMVLDDAGCQIAGRLFTGVVTFDLTRGEKQLNLGVDLSGLKADGVSVPVSARYGRCDQRHQISFSGRGAHEEREVQLDLSAELTEQTQAQLPIERAVVLLDGLIEITEPVGSQQAIVSRLRYEPGRALPAGGAIAFHTASGHLVQVTFAAILWRVNQVEIQIDDHPPFRTAILL